MSNTIKIRRGSGVPTASDFDAYELAYDYTGNDLYVKVGTSMVKINSEGSGTVTNVVAGNGLSGGGTVTATLDLDFSQLTDMTSDISGTTEFILQNGSTESRKAASEIKLTAFDATGFTIAGTVDTSGSPSANEYARFTDNNTIEGRSYSAVRNDLGLNIGSNVLAYNADVQTIAALNPGVNEDGKVLSWNEGNETYELVAQSGSTNSTATSSFITGDSLASYDGYIMTRGIVNESETGTSPAAIVFGNGATYVNDNISLITAGSTALFINASGNIGIGGTAANRDLQINGTGIIRLKDADGDPGLDFGDAEMQLRYRTASDKLQVYSYGTTSNVLTIQKSNGYVGIGTESPSQTLEVAGAIKATGTGGFTIGNVAGLDRIQNSSNSFSFLTDGNAYASMTFGTVTAGTWQGTAINATYVGNLPASKITSGTFADARISSSSEWNEAYAWGDHSTAGYLTSSSTQSKYLRSDANDTATGTIDFTGRVNIGNSLTRPDALDSDGDAHVRIGGSDVYLYVASLGVNGGYDVAVQAARASDFASFDLNLQANGGNLQRAGNKVWDAGNDGPNSGLNADLLDGQQGSSYMRSDSNQDFSGTLSYTPDTGTILSVDGQAVIQRMTANGAITIGHDDAVIIAGGDTSGTLNSNINNATETVFVGAEGGFVAYAFPNNDTSWSNRKELNWNGTNLTLLGNNVLTTASSINATTLDNYDSTRFFRRQGSASATVGPGWMTVATNTSGRQAGEILVTDGDSSDHGFIRIHWLRSYQDSNFTVINCGGHQNRITGVRVLSQDNAGNNEHVYGEKILQVYVTVSSSYDVKIFRMGDDAHYGDHTVHTPTIENTITGYSLHGNELTDLDTYGFAHEEGILAGGVIKSKSNMEAVNITSSGTITATRLDIKEGTTTVGDIQATDTTWLRLNQSTNKNIYTPRYIRADNGFFVDGSTLGLTGTGKLVLPANHDNDKITMYAGGNEKIGTEANTLLFTADNLKLKDVAGTTNFTVDSSGNITTGTWNGSVIASAYLDADTAHLSGTQTFTGAKTFGTQTWNGHITWNNGKNINVAGESSFDVSGGGVWQVWDSGTGAPFIMCDVGARTEIGSAGSRGLLVHGELESSSLDCNGDANIDGNVTLAAGHNFTAHNESNAGKYRMYGGSSLYAIGMVSGISYGGLSDWSMTFQFNDNSNRGFVFKDDQHSTSQGAMAITTNGKVTIAHSLRVGYGESDTTTPGATFDLDVDGQIYVRNTGSSGFALGEATNYLRIKGNGTSAFNFLNNGNGWANLYFNTAYANSHFQANNNGSLLKLNKSSWSNAPNHDIIYNAYRASIGDYTYVKAAGNGTGTHGQIIVADSYIFMGRTNIEEGAVSDSATAPMADTCFRLDASGNGLFDGDVVASSTLIASDIRLKENVEDLNYGLKDVMNMRAVSFDWKDKRDKTHDIGVIAQEMETIIPEVVNEIDTLNSDGEHHKTVDYAKLTSVLIKAIQEQQQQINELKEKLNG